MISPSVMWSVLIICAMSVIGAMVAGQLFPKSHWPPIIAAFSGLCAFILVLFVAVSLFKGFFAHKKEGVNARRF